MNWIRHIFSLLSRQKRTRYERERDNMDSGSTPDISKPLSLRQTKELLGAKEVTKGEFIYSPYIPIIETIILSKKNCEKYEKILFHPPKPNKALIDLFRKYRRKIN